MKNIAICREKYKFIQHEYWCYHIILKTPIFVPDLSLIKQKFGKDIIDILKNAVISGQLKSLTAFEIIKDEFKDRKLGRIKCRISITFQRDINCKRLKYFNKPLKFKYIDKVFHSSNYIEVTFPGDSSIKDMLKLDISRNKSVQALFPDLKKKNSEELLLNLIKRRLSRYADSKIGYRLIPNHILQLMISLL
jgi:hypothetical protein